MPTDDEKYQWGADFSKQMGDVAEIIGQTYGVPIVFVVCMGGVTEGHIVAGSYGVGDNNAGRIAMKRALDGMSSEEAVVIVAKDDNDA